MEPLVACSLSPHKTSLGPHRGKKKHESGTFSGLLSVACERSLSAAPPSPFPEEAHAQTGRQTP
jgi:hypothetical protein